jgi:VWFA-related protein
MTKRVVIVGLAAALCAVPLALVAQEAPSPREIGLEERTERRLAQIDVTVTGDQEVIESLTREDFELVVGGNFIEEFIVDRVCREWPDAAEASEPTETAPDRESAPVTTEVVTLPATFLFYFDQTFLTMAGRNQALEIARELIPEIVIGDNRAMIVSSGRELRTFVHLTSDTEALLGALETLESDRLQWDPTAFAFENEEDRIQEVLETLGSRGVQAATAVARRYQSDERWRSNIALRRFSMTLGQLADRDPPKAVIYFADRMRSKPGAHYLSIFSVTQQRELPVLRNAGLDAFGGYNAFDRVINEANAHGARVYTIQAEGLTAGSALARTGVAAQYGGSGSNLLVGNQHIHDAQDSLVGMAHETGGEAFINGAPTQKMVRRIRTDLSCLYLISYDPEQLPLDRGLAVLVRMKRKGVKVRHRGQTVIQSESSRLTSQILSAFASPDGSKPDAGIHGILIPTGFEDGEYTALVQISVDGSPLPNSSWDVGASLVSREKVRQDESARIAVSGPGTPVVFETEMTFRPGPFEIVMVAHEANSRQIVRTTLEGSWPDLDAEAATVGPIAVLQPAEAAFLRQGEQRARGGLGRGNRQVVEAELPTAVVALICRAKKQKGPLVVERRLAGDSAAHFPEMSLDLGDDRCAQIRDLIPAASMTEGMFTYEVRVLQKDAEVAAASHRFATVEAAVAGATPVRPLGS